MVRTLLSGKHVNNNGTDEIVLKSAMCLFNGQTEQAIGLIRAWKGRDINCVQNIQMFRNQLLNQTGPVLVNAVSSPDRIRRISETIVLMTFLGGCTDNISCIVGYVQSQFGLENE